MRTTSEVTPAIAHHVIWEYGLAQADLGYPGGSFIRSLIAAIMRADPGNRNLLAESYPGYVEACNVIELRSDGFNTLREIALEGVKS